MADHPAPPLKISERAVVFLVAAVQFTNILDFMMVMPLGPDFAVALGIPASKLGMIGGSYTLAAAVSGVVCSFFLDRFDRRKALAVTMLGLAVGTAAGGLAQGLGSLMLARVVAGAFGGPATSLALSIVADVVPPQRRGKAMGAVMGAFSVASVLGVPAGLKLATMGTWRTPFFVVAAVGLLITLLGVFLLPPLRLHLEARARAGTVKDLPLRELLSRPLVQLSYLTGALTMMSGFILIPNISAYVQFNLGYPRDHLDELYMYGGIISFLTMRMAGSLVDRFGSARVMAGATVPYVAVVYAGFMTTTQAVPVLAVFILFMGVMSFRNVSYNTLASRVPNPAERARFMSIQSAVQHLASATGAFASAQMLVENPDHTLNGMHAVALTSVAMSLALAPMQYLVENRVRTRDAKAVLSAPVATAESAHA
ncbi:MAG: MFS transporter [Myxococcota bacterium]